MERGRELYVPPLLVEIGDFRNRTLGWIWGGCRDHAGWGKAYVCFW